MPELSELLYRIRHSLDTQVSMSRIRRQRTLEDAITGRRVLITGASSGIGRAAARQLGAAGATVLLVARREPELLDTAHEVEAAGGKAAIYPCDLNDFDALDAMIERVLTENGGVDLLVNNAGRSIRRKLDESYERFHDYERTMRLNYLAPVRLMLAVLPGMRERRDGQIVNILSAANLYRGPGYSAYVASKAALDSLGDSLQAETHTENVRFTSIYMPLVRTDMIAPNPLYADAAALTPQQGAQIIADAVIDRPRRLGPLLGRVSSLIDTALPERADALSSARFRTGM
ncbi:SDR family NAD(P)-dependent oxidoreductase [Nocardia sp. NBC_01503]|uniref:SDR family NAD(P)-dependent oxidoreductase n=1 Tax=Nocardia sp. NBC_01503 TaxID=2975997 RepID=UPI002E7C03E1|nr:SDR family NAD(P)-dependent oxidoreductase [Nocardia sp. NBC_01503]WTL35120.1 SDR family NAD(P)-dependent oxidoreductase [Nocardia sp. NBC_01503]